MLSRRPVTATHDARGYLAYGMVWYGMVWYGMLGLYWVLFSFFDHYVQSSVPVYYTAPTMVFPLLVSYDCLFSTRGESRKWYGAMCTWLWQSFAVERLASFAVERLDSCPQSVGSSLERPNARAR